MDLILSLIFMPSLTFDIKPHYKPNHCYYSNNKEIPNTVKILSVEKTNYKYRIFYGNEIKWGKAEFNSSNFYTIEYVYNKEIVCP